MCVSVAQFQFSGGGGYFPAEAIFRRNCARLRLFSGTVSVWGKGLGFSGCPSFFNSITFFLSSSSLFSPAGDLRRLFRRQQRFRRRECVGGRRWFFGSFRDFSWILEACAWSATPAVVLTFPATLTGGWGKVWIFLVVPHVVFLPSTSQHLFLSLPLLFQFGRRFRGVFRRGFPAANGGGKLLFLHSCIL